MKWTTLYTAVKHHDKVFAFEQVSKVHQSVKGTPPGRTTAILATVPTGRPCAPPSIVVSPPSTVALYNVLV